MPEFSSSATLKCSAADLRRYLGLTANLPQISDPDLELTVLKAPEVVTEGEIIEFRITAYGLKQKMQHRYTKVTDTEIVAEQTEGPTRSWVHTQTITDNNNGTCQLRDVVQFEPPGGMMGFILTAAKISASLQSGMEYRYEALAELLGDGG